MSPIDFFWEGMDGSFKACFGLILWFFEEDEDYLGRELSKSLRGDSLVGLSELRVKPISGSTKN